MAEDKRNNNPLNNIKPKSNQQKPKFNMSYFYIVLILILFGINFFATGKHSVETSWNEVKNTMIKNNDVRKIVVVNKEEANIFLKESSYEKYKDKFGKGLSSPGVVGPHFSFTIGSVDKFEENLEKAYADFQTADSEIVPITYDDTYDWGGLLGIIFPFALIIFFWWFMFRRVSKGGGAGGGNIFSVGKSQAKLFDTDQQVTTTFKDVAGLSEAKQEIEEIVSFLKNPSKYTKLGGKIPKGALLVGPPGTGKTLLAKAVAGEANVPFFSMSGSDFVEMFVGVGASRVRDLFKQAKEKAPCIVFIDEIDAVGRARGRNVNMGGNDERENTLNQLLTEMDGFGSNSGVIILAATNRADILDKALLRAGRFDRQIHVELPDVHERKEIFQVHIRPLKMDDSVDIDFLARQTPGFSGADIANVCNEAALIAARKNKSTIQKQDFLDAVDRIVGGLEKKTKITTEEEKRSIAYHEAGHATISWKLQYANPLVKVTIVPRGEALGAAWYLPEERQLTNKEHILDEMCATLGGRAAEEVFFHTASTGAINDLERVTKQAYAMVGYYGMSSQLSDLSGNSDYGFTKPYSEITAELIDQEAKKIVNEQYERAKSILEANKEGHNALAQVLIDKEVLFADDVEAILGKRPWISRADELLSESKKENQNLSNDVESKSLDTDNNNTLNTENNESKE